MTADHTPERLADRAQIHDVICRWSRAIDRLDFAAIPDLFHPEAIDHHGAFEGDRDGLVEWIRERRSRIPFSMRNLGDMLIEFSGPDLAAVEICSITLRRYPTEDRASLTGPGWRGRPHQVCRADPGVH